MTLIAFLGGLVAGVFMNQVWRDWIKNLLTDWYNKIRKELQG